MKGFIFSDCYRIDGLTGNAVEASTTRNKALEFNDAYRVGLTSEGTAEFDASKNFPRQDSAVLHAARNEYISFQIALEDIVVPYEDIEFKFEPLSPAEDGGTIAADNFSVFFEWYHQLKGMLVPDLLVPWDKHDKCKLSELANTYFKPKYTAFWVDLFIPEGTEPGAYNGKFKVSANGAGELVEFAVELTVYDTTLCNEALIHADMNNYADTITRNHPNLVENDKRFEDGSYFAAEWEYNRVTHEHRGVFHHLPYTHSGYVYQTFAPVLEGEGNNIRVSDWSAFDAHYAPLFDGSAFKDTKRGPIPVPFTYTPFNFDWPSSYEKWGKKGYKVEYRRILQEYIKHFEEKGWINTTLEIFYNHKKRYRAFPYDGDETRHAHDEEIIHTFYDIFGDIIEQSTVKVVFRTDASWSYGVQYPTEISKKIKMWCVGSGILQFFPESYQYMKEQGDILWTYTGLPTMEADMTGIFQWPMRCLQNDLGGFLYWNSTGIGRDYLKCPAGNGTTTLYYPSDSFGIANSVFPSIRLKYQRNAMQTTDLIKMHEGTWTFHNMRDAINNILNITKDKWHCWLPEELKIPPHKWTNNLLGNAFYNKPLENATPEVPNQIKKTILEMAGNFKGATSLWG